MAKKKNKKNEGKLSPFEKYELDVFVQVPNFIEYTKIMFGLKNDEHSKRVIARMSPLRIFIIFNKMQGKSTSKQKDTENYAIGKAIQNIVAKCY